MAPQSETVAVLGLGAMGHGMASSALRAGIPTVAWSRDAVQARNLAAIGADVAETATDAVGRAGIVVTMVTDADAVMSNSLPHGHGASEVRSLRQLGDVIAQLV